MGKATVNHPESLKQIKQYFPKSYDIFLKSTKRGTALLPDAVKAYASRLGKAGLDYRAIRVSRTETAQMLSDEQTDIARNSAISSGKMDFVTDRGRDAWSCNCQKYADQSPWDVDDPGRPEIPVHPNCGCTWKPHLLTDAEMMARFKKEDADDLEAIRAAGKEQELSKVIEEMTPDFGPEPLPVRFSNVGLNEQDLMQLPSNTRTEIITGIENVYKDIPEAKGAVTKIGVNNRLTRAYAQCYSEEGKIELGGNSYKDKTELQKKYERDVSLNYHPIGTDYKAIITHETAHAMVGKIAREQGVDYKQLCSEIQEKVLKELGLNNNKNVKADNLSRYGAAKPTEFIAEAYAEYMHSPSPRPIAQKVGAMIKSLLGGTI